MRQTMLLQFAPCYQSSSPYDLYARASSELDWPDHRTEVLRLVVTVLRCEENRNACDAMQIYIYPSIQAFKVSPWGEAFGTGPSYAAARFVVYGCYGSRPSTHQPPKCSLLWCELLMDWGMTKFDTVVKGGAKRVVECYVLWGF